MGWKPRYSSFALGLAACSLLFTSAPVSASTTLIPVVVSKEVDGDTIHVRMANGGDETIRMLLIDTPEDVKPHTPVEPFSLDAAAFAKKELPVGKHIEIEEGKPGYQRDKYGRLLAFVYVTPNDMYNEDVVKLGLARVGYIYPPNTQHLSALESDQQYAKSHKLGIWTIPGYVTPNGYNLNAARASGWKGVSRPGTSASSGAKSGTTSSGTAKSGATAGGTGKSGTAGSGGGSTGTAQTTASGGLKVVSSSLSVARGSYASVTIQTKRGTQGTIEVDYKSGPSHAQGLVAKGADGRGVIAWSWEVGTHTTPGNWPVTISAGGKTVQLTLSVH